MTSMETKMPAAPTPAIALETIKNGIEFAKPHISDPISKMVIAARLNR